MLGLSIEVWPRRPGIAVPLTWDSAKKSANITLSNGDLDAISTTAAFNPVLGTTSRSSGKYYYEIKVVDFDGANAANFIVGIATVPGAYNTHPGNFATSFGIQGNTVKSRNGFSAGTNGYAPPDGLNVVIGFAVDLDAGKLWYSWNGDFDALTLGADPATGTNAHETFTANLTLYPACAIYDNIATNKLRILSGGSLTYSPPSGFSSWA